MYGLDLPWDGDYIDAGRRLLNESVTAIRGEVPDLLEARINNEGRLHSDARCHVMETVGMELFHEKRGFSWIDDGSRVAVGDRLEFRSVAETGTDAFRSVMAACGEGTLDRNDRYYWEGCGPDNWSAQMITYLTEEDASMWLVGYHDRLPVGFVAVGSDDDWGSTIIHIGVLPEHRGNGYIDDLIGAGTAAAQGSGVATMLSDVDVINEPMMNAMRRAGHSAHHRPWHVWVYRADTIRIAKWPRQTHNGDTR